MSRTQLRQLLIGLLIFAIGVFLYAYIFRNFAAVTFFIADKFTSGLKSAALVLVGYTLLILPFAPAGWYALYVYAKRAEAK